MSFYQLIINHGIKLMDSFLPQNYNTWEIKNAKILKLFEEFKNLNA